MSDVSFECPACAGTIEPKHVLAALAEQGLANEITDDDADLEMACPQCDADVTFGSAEIVVKLSADEATLALFQVLRKADTATTTHHEPDYEKLIEREREAKKRREELRAKLEDIEDSL